MPNPNYRPQGYGAPASVTGGVVCNFFGSDSLEVPAGEKFSVTYDVSGARREIKVDTSPKSTTQYTRQPTTSATTNSLMNQYGYANQDPYSLTTGAVAAPTSVQGQATITAPKKKGKLKVSLVIDAVRQNSEACKPIEITISESVPQSTTSTSDYSGSDSTPSSYASDSQPLDSGQVIETPSEIIAQNRRTVSAKQQPVETAPADDDAYAYLCKTLGIGCAKDAPTLSETPRIRDLQVKTNPSNEITIDPDAEDPADLPNIGEPQNGEQTANGPVQNIATDIGIDGDGKNVKHSAVLDYLSDNGQYAPPIGPNSDKSGVLNSSDDTSGGTAENRVGIFTRLWRWFLNLLGFGPEYVG